MWLAAFLLGFLANPIQFVRDLIRNHGGIFGAKEQDSDEPRRDQL